MRLFYPVAIGLLCGLVILLVASRFLPDGSPEIPAAPVAAAATPAAVISRNEFAEVERQETIERVKELEKMELAKRQREEAAEKTRQLRAQLQLAKRSAWRQVIEAHRKEFEGLRAASAQAPDQILRCSICDGQGVLDLCVLCEHTGKCPSCHGTGKYWDGICPTCLGTGKCFLCIGTGKMPCPFSQSLPRIKEVITPDTPDPSDEIPIN